MNYLGHLYFSKEDTQLMYANLYGDFVKGSNLSHLPSIIQKGTKLHRDIDSYIDRHPLILDLKKNLSVDLPKINGIAVDLYFDHWLAKNWEKHHQKSLEEFTSIFHNTPLNSTIYTNENFILLLKIMKKDQWLNRYKEIEGLNFAATGLSRRISFENNLWVAADVYTSNQELIESTFELFFPQANKFFNT